MAYQHGVYVSEEKTALTTPIQGTAALQVIIGTAPVNRVDNLESVLEPKLVYSFQEAQAALGYSEDFAKYSLSQSMDACFRVFAVAPIVLINVLDPKKHKKANVETEVPITAGVATYRAPGVLLASVKVKASTGATTYQKDKDYTLAFDDAGNAEITILPTGTAADATAVKVESDSIDPAMVTDKEILGGTTAANVETGMALIRQVYPRFGMVPGIILAPGWSHRPVVAAAMQAACESINGVYQCECLLDLDCSATGTRIYSDVGKGKSALGASSAHAAVMWPMLGIGDKKYRFSALMGPCAATTDIQNGDVPNLSPSNKFIRATSVILEDGTPVLLDQDRANLTNGLGIISALNVSGTIKTWGNSTAAFPGNTDPKDRFFCVRRFFSWWSNFFILTYFQKVDDPTNARLIENICDSENIKANGFVASGKCAGAHITYNERENTVTDIMAGKITFRQELAPYTPAEVIRNILVFDPKAILAELSETGQ